MINFDSLPNGKPVGAIIPKGRYFAKVESAEMKSPKDPAKPAYINLRYSLKTADNKAVGNIFDGIYESEHALMQYKLKRFLMATGITFTGTFDLKDLQKIVTGKEFIVDVTVQSQEGQQDKSVVDLFTNEIFYNLSEAKDLFEGELADDLIHASDALDANTDGDTDEF